MPQHTISFSPSQGPRALISLISTRRPDEFILRLNGFPHARFLGVLRGDTFSCGQTEEPRFSQWTALSSLLFYSSEISFRWVSVYFAGAKHLTTREFFKAHATPVEFPGLEPHLKLDTSLWGREIAEEWEEQQRLGAGSQ